MLDALGVIFPFNDTINLSELNEQRTIAGLPIGGRYRLIDFIISNMVNCGINNISLVTNKKYQSMLNHLGAGDDFGLNRKGHSFNIIPPYASSGEISDVSLLSNAIRVTEKFTNKYVIISNSNSIYNFNFADLIEFYEAKNADIALLAPDNSGNIITNTKGKVVDLNSDFNFFAILIERNLFHELLAHAKTLGATDFIADVLVKNFEHLDIYHYLYEKFYSTIDSVKKYFDFNMSLLDEKIRLKVFENNVYTKSKDCPPTRYAEGADVQNCLIADGCFIDGKVKNSIIFRGVKIGSKVDINNCIIMQDTIIQDNVKLENIILDKQVVIRKGQKLVGQASYPVVVAKKAVV
ncbi:MAG: glucose-1-phosphate adenylyltransferase subunit GlgD [Clostridiales bacterium]|jgi:glucose-1-phosphate adenylyltransferase|nr:glucose-1-phosphate adenylyltransferase subunit GlgD [Clostridiales bacterium]